MQTVAIDMGEPLGVRPRRAFVLFPLGQARETERPSTDLGWPVDRLQVVTKRAPETPGYEALDKVVQDTQHQENAEQNANRERSETPHENVPYDKVDEFSNRQPFSIVRVVMVCVRWGGACWPRNAW